MSDLTPEQIAKLPKWAQAHIEHLERRIAQAEARFDLLHDRIIHPSEKPGAITVGHRLMGSRGHWFGLPPTETINFHMPYGQGLRNEGGEFSVRWLDHERKTDDFTLDIHAHDHIAIYPRSSNGLWLKVQRP